MASFADKLNNKTNESTTITYKCDKCGECKNKFFIHLDMNGNNKYICSYLCSKDMHITYGKDYWDKLVNIEDFQHLTPLIYRRNYKPNFEIEYDMLNPDRNDTFRELEEEDRRIEELEKEYEMDYSSDGSSDYGY